MPRHVSAHAQTRRQAESESATGRDCRRKQSLAWGWISRIARCDSCVSREPAWMERAQQPAFLRQWIRMGLEHRSRKEDPFADRRRRRLAGGRGNPAAGWKLHAAIPARQRGFLRWERQLGARPTSVQRRREGRRRNSTHLSDRRSRRRNADKFLSPFRFALRMSRRTEVGSHGHSISNAPRRKDLHSLVTN